jgi:hypothetical protein
VKRGRLFWISAVVGWAFIGWGLRGVFHYHIDTRPGELARFFIGGALIHDLILAPVVLLVGYVVVRVAPAGWRAYVQAALIISGLLILFTYPEVRDYARVLHNPTSLPHNYTANLAIVIGVVWGVTGLVAVIHRVRSRSRPLSRWR